jgi:tripartite-type tricarboxylate transporter receptor subunit TctC
MGHRFVDLLAVPAVHPIDEHNAVTHRRWSRRHYSSAEASSPASAGTAAAELLQKMSGVKLRYIPYKSVPQAVTDMLGGSLDFVVVDVPSVQGLIQQGRLTGLAVTSLERHRTSPNIPAWSECGMPGFEMPRDRRARARARENLNRP